MWRVLTSQFFDPSPQLGALLRQWQSQGKNNWKASDVGGFAVHMKERLSWCADLSTSLPRLMTWAVRTLTDLETNMMSLVRVKELTDLEEEESATSGKSDGPKPRKIPKEHFGAGEGLESLSSLPKTQLAPANDVALDGWPWQGDLTMRNISMRYNEVSPLVLKRINLNLPRGTTLGVVGRSGSGNYFGATLSTFLLVTNLKCWH